MWNGSGRGSGSEAGATFAQDATESGTGGAPDASPAGAGQGAGEEGDPALETARQTIRRWQRGKVAGCRSVSVARWGRRREVPEIECAGLEAHVLVASGRGATKRDAMIGLAAMLVERGEVGLERSCELVIGGGDAL